MALSRHDAGKVGVAIQLLADIRQIFSDKGIERISSADLLEALTADDERQWLTYNNGKEITKRQVANKLRGFDIGSKSMRITGIVHRGYELKDFVDSFERYLVDPSEKDQLQVTKLGEDMETVTSTCNTSEDVTVTNSNVLRKDPCEHTDVTCNSKNPPLKKRRFLMRKRIY